ncbi:MAG: DUF3256 family protein [Prevotella sp.]|nr:DUF3256 family protein [Prevotella sp.]
MRKILYILSLAFCLTTPANAQDTMVRFLAHTPEHVFEFIPDRLFAELPEYVQLMRKSQPLGGEIVFEVKNRFNDTSRIDTISNDYAALTMAETLHVQMLALPYEKTDTVVCMIKTYYGPEAESVISFYDLNWNRLSNADFMPQVQEEEFFAKPDSMTDQRFDELKRWIEPVIWKAEIIPSLQQIVFTLSTPMLTQEEKTQVNAILLQRKVKWGGKMFEKC